MPVNRLTICGIVGLLALLPAQAAGDLTTLFTTPQERQLINANRYKRDEAKQTVQQDKPEQSPVQVLLQEEVTVEYRISGISLSGDGAHTVWINANAYEDGERLGDRSRIKVITGDGVKVRITTPDGKHYFGTSGETLAVTYMATVEN
ncbi:MAG: hypothetical protein GY875_03780 [Gammaproteobacteria bacterium]|nr:hypothetical protein [Gammaproteobacteria bacterium]